MTQLYLLCDPNIESNTEDIFNRILQDTRKINSIGDHKLTGFSSETIKFRYFDTFDAVLTSKHIFNYFRQVDSFVDPPAKVQEYGYVYTVEFPGGKMKSEDIQQIFIPKGIDFYRLSPYDFKYWGPMNRVKQVGRNDQLQEQLRLDINYNRFSLKKEKDESSVLISLDEIVVTGNFNHSAVLYQLLIKTVDNDDRNMQPIYDFLIGKDTSCFYLAPEPIWVKAKNLILGEKINKTPAKLSVT